MTDLKPELDSVPDPFDVTDPFPHELPFKVREQSLALGMDIVSFVGQWSLRGLDPVNAGRLLAIDEISSALDGPTLDRLYEINGRYDTEDVPGKIIAPALRVRGDFKGTEEVYKEICVQPGKFASWNRYRIIGIDEIGNPTEAIVADDNPKVAETYPIITEPIGRLQLLIDPKSPHVYTLEDFAKLLKPEGRRRLPGINQALANAVLLCHFDETIEEGVAADEQGNLIPKGENSIGRVLRYFSLNMPENYPKF